MQTRLISRYRAVLGASLGAAFWAACAAAPRGAPKPTSTSPREAATQMEEHFKASVEIKNAVIANDLILVHSFARVLAENEGPFPDSWALFVANNTRLAMDALNAEDLPAAAQAAAGLADTCGQCHAALGGGPRFAAVVAPSRQRRRDSERHMARHQWAADRMWEALVAHDDARWAAGAAVFARDVPLHGREFLEYAHSVAGSAGLDSHVRELGKRAIKSEQWPERVHVYGELLATCAGCHARWL